MGGPPIVVYLMALSHHPAVIRASLSCVSCSPRCSSGAVVWKGLIDREICYGRSRRCQC
jgi:hypothetical protein